MSYVQYKRHNDSPYGTRYVPFNKLAKHLAQAHGAFDLTEEGLNSMKQNFVVEIVKC